jgi:murein DD-endopeptidase MepM/ murein hydrolase activator NlpD
MIEEPEITPEDTNPRKAFSLEDRLRSEEPPLAADDTSPSRSVKVHEALRAEEPPILLEDTSPSIVNRQALSEHWPPQQHDSAGGFQRMLALAMLLGAVILSALAGYLWMSGEKDDSEDQTGGSVAQVATQITDSTPQPPTVPATSAPRATPAEQAVVAVPTLNSQPTAAADEIAAALLTPAPGEPVNGIIPRESEPFTIRPITSRSSIVQYTVQQGDTLESIASRFGLGDYYTIIWSNSRNHYNPLREGAQLNILPEDGVYYEVTSPISVAALADQYKVDPYTIIDSEYNNLFGSSPDTLLVQGMWVVVPGGQGERVNLLPPNLNTNTTDASGSISGTYSLWGCNATIRGGTAPYTRPLDSYTFMQGFSPSGHQGVDLAANVGTPVHAAGGGTVVYAGWNDTGYGRLIVIAHGTAFTFYGHLNSINVQCNQEVSAGATIGTVGSTGNSSGPHLHFEVHDANWNTRNPADYIGF